MGVRLLEEAVGLLPEDLQSVGTRGKTNRRLVQRRQGNERFGQLGGIPALFAVHRLPRLHVVRGALGVVLYGGLRVLGGLWSEELRTEETRLDEHGGDA